MDMRDSGENPKQRSKPGPSHETNAKPFRVEIVIVYRPRYRHGHEADFVPPITGLHLAALTPPHYRVRVVHQQVQSVDFDTDADLIALSFFTGFAPEAYRLAHEFRRRGKLVVAGGPHVTFNADEALEHVDSVVLGEAESIWTQMLDDASTGRLRSRYTGTAQPLAGLPTPRYDLLGANFFIQRVVQATRGCPFTCSFCTVPTINPGFRTRPVAEVIRDVQYDRFRHWWQRKVVWFWDDNLTAKRSYIRELLAAMIPLRKWWLTQASMDIGNDKELLDLMERSGCIGIFFGIESFGAESLRDAHKPQNKISTYEARIRELHDRGICVMAGFIAGFDGDTPESIVAMARQLYSCRNATKRIDSGRSPCRRIASENRGAQQDDPGQRQGSRIIGLGLEQKRFDKPDPINAAGTLIASPTAASSRTRRRTIQTTAPRCAPRAIRIPISPTCRATL
jgi:hypothetical protein